MEPRPIVVIVIDAHFETQFITERIDREFISFFFISIKTPTRWLISSNDNILFLLDEERILVDQFFEFFFSRKTISFRDGMSG